LVTDGYYSQSLYFEKYILPVKEIQEKPFRQQQAEQYEYATVITERIGKAMNENIYDDTEVEQSLHNIDRYWIKSDDHEREGPFTESFDINDVEAILPNDNELQTTAQPPAQGMPPNAPQSVASAPNTAAMQEGGLTLG
jgi:hypothetical protein